MMGHGNKEPPRRWNISPRRFLGILVGRVELYSCVFGRPTWVTNNGLEITSRVRRLLTDDAFRNIALGDNFVRFTGIDWKAPQICKRPARSTAIDSGAVAR